MDYRDWGSGDHRVHNPRTPLHRGRAHLSHLAGAAIRGFLTPRGYRAVRTRPPSDREARDEQLIADLRSVRQQNHSVYGVNKMHRAMRRRGWQVGREQTRR